MLKKALLLTVLSATLGGCGSLLNEAPKGVYKRVGGHDAFTMDQFEVTESKVVLGTYFGEMASEYKIEEGYLYTGAEGAQIRFKIVSPDTLQNDANVGFQGTYVKVQ